jgi:hypothetical protein
LLLRTSEPLKNVRWANLAVLPDFDEGDLVLLHWIEDGQEACLGDLEVKAFGLRISWNYERALA